MIYGVVGEDRADVESLKAIIRNIGKRHSVPISRILGKGYSGCDEMFRKAVGQLHAFLDLGCRRLIVCFDADGPDPSPRRKRVVREIFDQLATQAECCALIPVYKIEAWILADLNAVKIIFPSANLGRPVQSPERVKNPKHELRSRTRCPVTHNIRYQEGSDNERIAPHLDPDTLENKCPEFKRLVEFIVGPRGGKRTGRKKQKRRR